MVDEIQSEASSLSGAKMIVAFVWIISLVVVGYAGYMLGQQGTDTIEKSTDTNVLNAMTNVDTTPTSVPPTPSSPPSPLNVTCAKSGYAQKWEYLTPYEVKEKESVPLIAEAELGDATRANEIIQLNGLPLVAGTTIYLPPTSIKKSNGYLKQVNGRIITQNASSWHLSFNNDEKGRGILIPTYWFDDVPEAATYHVGDCVSVLFDEGFKVFSVSPQ